MRVTLAVPGDETWAPVISAVQQGFASVGDEVKIGTEDSIPDAIFEWTQLICLFGHSGNRPIFRRFNRAAKHVLLVDRGYICPRDYYRLALDGWQNRWMSTTDYDPERLTLLLNHAGLTLQPHRNHGLSAVTYAGMTSDFATWHNLGDPRKFDINQAWGVVEHFPASLEKLLLCAPYSLDGLVWIPKHVVDARAVYDLSLNECLEKSCCLVTWGQPAGVLALIKGIPVIDLAHETISPLYPIVDRVPSHASNAHWPHKERIIGLSRLAHNEFSLDELATGGPLWFLNQHTIKRIESITDPGENVTEQYRLMHENPKRFRGGLSDTFVKEIGRLVAKHGAATLLDYGSGKGRQYEEFEQHKSWVLSEKPTCYDPGYPPFAIKPERMFDGVICTDVAEHWPPSKVDENLAEVIGYARKFAFFVIFTDAATKSLPDGRNAHLTINPPDWWNKRISDAMSSRPHGHSIPKVKQVSPNAYVLTNAWFETVVFYRNSSSAKDE